MVMGWPRGCFLPTPGAPLAVSPLSNEPTASVRARMGEPRETPNPKRRRRSRRTAFILPYLLGVAFRETLWPAPNPRRTPAAPLPADAGRSLRLRDPQPQNLLPPLSLCRRGAGSDETSGKEQTPKGKKQPKNRQTPTNRTQTQIGESQRGANPAGGTAPVPAGSRGAPPRPRAHQEPLFWGEKPGFDAKRPPRVHAGCGFGRMAPGASSGCATPAPPCHRDAGATTLGVLGAS